MNSTNKKKVYVYKMNLIPANVLCILIFILMIIFSSILKITFYVNNINLLVLFISIIGYLMLHELLHGVGYFIGGTKHKNISYGIELEKGIFYAMAYQELSKKNILISLQMPFIVIGVITYIIGAIFNIPILVLLSIINICGACMDIVMFIFFLRLPKDIKYSESGMPDEFVIITDKDISNKKSLFLKNIKVKDYKMEDFDFNNIKKFKITKLSIIILICFILLGLISIFI